MSGVKVHILESCSGTEPYEGRHHTSAALETEKGLYWLDAGECCSYAAHLMGIDLLKTRGIFIPYQESYEAVMNLLAHTEDNFRCGYDHEGRLVQDGVLYQDTEEEDEIIIETIHNHHLAHEEGSPWHSFSFNIEVLKKCGKKTKKLLFIHHGVKILENPDWARREVKSQWGDNAVIAEDGMTILL